MSGRVSRVSSTRSAAASPGAMRIGELARRTGVSRDTIRFYEKAGLLSPRVSPNGYRLFDASHLDLLRSIRIAQVLGFTLAEIKRSMGRWETMTSAARARFLEDKLAVIDERMRELEAMRAHLVEKVAWIRSEKKGVPEALDAAASVRKRTPPRR